MTHDSPATRVCMRSWPDSAWFCMFLLKKRSSAGPVSLCLLEAPKLGQNQNTANGNIASEILVVLCAEKFRRKG